MRCLVMAGVVCLLGLTVACQPGSASDPDGSGTPDPASVDTTAVEFPMPALDETRIIVDKSDRTLVLYEGNEPVRTYRIALGSDPVGDKEREGDGRTPEGEYYVCSKNPHSQHQMSLGLSYPNKEDAARGLASGLISQDEHDAIVAAIQDGGQPPWDTALGGEIMIHGRGTASDWTQGCIAMIDTDVTALYGTAPVGTPVTIVP